MKKKSGLILAILTTACIAIITFSSQARSGASKGLALAENTIIPSLLPLLIIFFMIMKSGAKDIIAKYLGFISVYLFNLPRVTFPAVLFGLTGGYPTGALLTQELLDSGEIDEAQARRMMSFNFCGGCGFIITALGSAVLGSTKAGVLLFLSNILSSLTLGIILSFTQKRESSSFYSFSEEKSIGDVLTASTHDAISCVLNITAFVMLFCTFDNIFHLPPSLAPFIEITNGVCGGTIFPLPQISAYLCFGGICIHFQLLGSMLRAKMRYSQFLFYRVFGALLSYCYTKILLLIFPLQIAVFSNSSVGTIEASSINLLLSCLMVIGSVVFIGDISSKKYQSR